MGDVLFSHKNNQRTRGPPFRLEEWSFHLKQRRWFFTVRAVRLGNALPSDVVIADSVNVCLCWFHLEGLNLMYSFFNLIHLCN
ncbi:hypothetical protein XENTR_v10004094 [Xenopus tropicalis]|nr:hypothetical protein XENTR_v10004094 [Xenopus tropicalis]